MNKARPFERPYFLDLWGVCEETSLSRSTVRHTIIETSEDRLMRSTIGDAASTYLLDARLRPQMRKFVDDYGRADSTDEMLLLRRWLAQYGATIDHQQLQWELDACQWGALCTSCACHRCAPLASEFFGRKFRRLRETGLRPDGIIHATIAVPTGYTMDVKLQADAIGDAKLSVERELQSAGVSTAFGSLDLQIEMRPGGEVVTCLFASISVLRAECGRLKKLLGQPVEVEDGPPKQCPKLFSIHPPRTDWKDAAAKHDAIHLYLQTAVLLDRVGWGHRVIMLGIELRKPQRQRSFLALTTGRTFIQSASRPE